MPDRVPEVERWGVHEIEVIGPEAGNPFLDTSFSARFQFRNRIVEVDGFYDGDGRHVVRFMPDEVGEWRFTTHSDVDALDGRSGAFRCVPPAPDNHGPVLVSGPRQFAYADGTRYFPFGTTCYHWTHEMDQAHEEETLRSLADSPYNKVRMCLLPTANMRPPHTAFVGHQPGALDKTRFNPVFFAHLERRIRDLCRISVEADVILFHPYDKGHWGVDNMTAEEDLRFAGYVVARLAAFRNVWWSIANEFDFNKSKTVADWDTLLRHVQRCDPYQRLRSIHNGTRMYEYASLYDFGKPWVTHQSIQHWSGEPVSAWLEACPKPVVVDEIGYEGDIERRWGNLTAAELVDRVWEGTARGGYVGHGECFRNRETGPWISVGGRLYGESTERIAFLRRLLESDPDARLEYFGGSRPARFDLRLPKDTSHRVELIDTWNMTVRELGDDYRGECGIELPGRPYLALRIRKAGRRHG